ncbi:hypothetical protein [Chryseobacterium vrystaatense]|uniref:Uncharacterized protein n=1 Tax=Chryseobacterium vrystaatense TaxID=307480 RepID=A0A1M4ZMP5_9FLAO|nr:hypothetical protein [Chryseobacterium vrystaatense]SHF19271.1 hypothetical protein SAMN02787073_1645 [Chryseobacterium vrystaatense]
MEIAGIIKSKHVDHVRLITSDKKQEIDVFYTESKKFDIEEIFENEVVLFSGTCESVDYYGLKLAKFWLLDIILPKKKFVYQGKKRKGDNENSNEGWADRHTK